MPFFMRSQQQGGSAPTAVGPAPIFLAAAEAQPDEARDADPRHGDEAGGALVFHVFMVVVVACF
jgi:hypothetical protein